MKLAIRLIDRALKNLYNIDSPFRAELFLLAHPPKEAPLAANPEMKGAFYVQRGSDSEMRLGIFLSQAVRSELGGYKRWQSGAWTLSQLSAFSVAAEEISHFKYFLFHTHENRSVSQFELEMQGEVDKFLLAYFASGADKDKQAYEALYEKLFHEFRLQGHLSDEQKVRYQDANSFARRLIHKWSALLVDKRRHEKLLRQMRQFYRMGIPGKLSFISKK